MPERITAIFDFNGTLVRGEGGGWFVLTLFKEQIISLGALVENFPAACAYFLGYRTPFTTVGVMQRLLRDKDRLDIDRVGRRFFREYLSPRIYPEAKKLLDQHRTRGHCLIIATAAPRFVVEHAASALGFEYLLCTDFELNDDRFTGSILGAPCWGKEKLKSLTQLAGEADIDLSMAYAYSNDYSDEPLLTSVGHPTVVNPDRQLHKLSIERQWPSIKFSKAMN